MRTANPEDEFFLVEFSDRPKLAAPLHRTPQAEILSRIPQYQGVGLDRASGCTFPGGGSNEEGAQFAQGTKQYFSDGGDNWSRRNLRLDQSGPDRGGSSGLCDGDLWLRWTRVNYPPKRGTARSYWANWLDETGGQMFPVTPPGRVDGNQHTHQP